MDHAGAVHLDYLAGTFAVEALSTVRGLAELFFEAGAARGGLRRYGDALSFGPGVVIGSSADRSEAFFECSGAAFSSMSLLAQFEFVQALMLQLDGDLPLFKGTRVDVAFDDYGRSVMVGALADRYIRPRRFGPFRSGQILEGVGGKGGDTVYLGRAGKSGGGCQLCVYDKRYESEGLVDCIRWEVRYFKDRAHAVLQDLSCAGGLDGFRQLLGSVVGGAVTFYEDDDRSVVAPWWATFRRGVWGCLVSRLSS